MSNQEKCTCGEPHVSNRIIHCYDGKPCYVTDSMKNTLEFNSLKWEEEFDKKFGTRDSVLIDAIADNVKSFCLSYFQSKLGELERKVNKINDRENREAWIWADPNKDTNWYLGFTQATKEILELLIKLKKKI